MKKELDDIDRAISDLKAIAARRGHKPDWSKIDHDLRSYFAELSLARTPILWAREKDGKQQTYHRSMAGTATLTQARKLLRRSEKALASAKELPDLLAQFAVGAYGTAGRASLPQDAVEKYSRALVSFEEFVSLHRAAFDHLLMELGNTQGRKGSTVEHLIGNPTVRFLRRMMLLWREATGRDKEGEPFEDFAKKVLDIGRPHGTRGKITETGDLSRQIKTAKKLNAAPLSEWEFITAIMNREPKRSRTKTRGK